MTATEPLPQELDYYSAPGLSQSGMKDLAVSPLRYWFRQINPNKPVDDPTPAQLFGLALHCAVLEPEKFAERYACAVSQEDFPDALDTMADLRGWLTDRGVKPKGTLKQELINQCLSVGPEVPIWQVIQETHARANDGNAILSKEMWANISGAANALRSQPALEPIFAEGRAEVPYFAIDPDTGVPLKGKLDWVTPYCTLDLKTFSQQRGKSIDETVNSAIWHERYHFQAYYYSLLRSLVEGGNKISGAQTSKEFIFAFVESEPPHEVRLRSIRPRIGGEVNLLWETARLSVRGLIRQYAECVKRFGGEPWIESQEIQMLADEDFPQLAYV